jgi:uncharacterized protein YqkB
MILRKSLPSFKRFGHAIVCDVNGQYDDIDTEHYWLVCDVNGQCDDIDTEHYWLVCDVNGQCDDIDTEHYHTDH